MRLEDWLKTVKPCPDRDVVVKEEDGITRSLLHRECGIYDNWPILLRADYDEVVRHLEASSHSRRHFSRKYRPIETLPASAGQRRQDFAYVRGTVIFQVSNFPTGVTFDEPDLLHHNRQLRDYTVTIMLHPYQDDKPVPGVHRHRVMAWVIEDICNYAVKRNISLCLPRSVGTKYIDDYSRIVYHPK